MTSKEKVGVPVLLRFRYASSEIGLEGTDHPQGPRFAVIVSNLAHGDMEPIGRYEFSPGTSSHVWVFPGACIDDMRHAG